MLRQQREDKAIILVAQTEEDRELIRKMSATPSKYSHLMAPIKGGPSEKLRGYSRNRKVTRGRRYDFIPTFREISSPLHAVESKKVPTGQYVKRKHGHKR